MAWIFALVLPKPLLVQAIIHERSLITSHKTKLSSLLHLQNIGSFHHLTSPTLHLCVNGAIVSRIDAPHSISDNQSVETEFARVDRGVFDTIIQCEARYDDFGDTLSV